MNSAGSQLSQHIGGEGSDRCLDIRMESSKLYYSKVVFVVVVVKCATYILIYFKCLVNRNSALSLSLSTLHNINITSLGMLHKLLLHIMLLKINP